MPSMTITIDRPLEQPGYSSRSIRIDGPSLCSTGSPTATPPSKSVTRTRAAYAQKATFGGEGGYVIEKLPSAAVVAEPSERVVVPIRHGLMPVLIPTVKIPMASTCTPAAGRPQRVIRPVIALG